MIGEEGEGGKGKNSLPINLIHQPLRRSKGLNFQRGAFGRQQVKLPFCIGNKL